MPFPWSSLPRSVFQLAAGVALLVAVIAWVSTTRASHVAAAGGISGRLPVVGAFGLIVWDGGPVEDLVRSADDQGCTLASVWANKLTADGLIVYIVGAPAFVNAEFGSAYPTLPASTPLLVQCGARSIRPVPTATPTRTPAPTPTSTPTPAPTPAPTANVAGNWHGTLSLQTGSGSPLPYQWSITFDQTGARVTGRFNYSASGSAGFDFLTGTIDNQGRLSLGSNSSGTACQRQFDATVQGRQLSGTVVWINCLSGASTGINNGTWEGTNP